MGFYTYIGGLPYYWFELEEERLPVLYGVVPSVSELRSIPWIGKRTHE